VPGNWPLCQGKHGWRRHIALSLPLPQNLMVGCTARTGVQEYRMSNDNIANSSVSYLVAAGTEAEASGQGAPLELGPLAGNPILLILQIDGVLEQESLHVSIWGSTDGIAWGTQALFWFPQKFYPGATPAALDLGQRPDLKFLQARWEANRWGRGIPRPYFRFGVEVQESTV